MKRAKMARFQAPLLNEELEHTWELQFGQRTQSKYQNQKWFKSNCDSLHKLVLTSLKSASCEQIHANRVFQLPKIFVWGRRMSLVQHFGRISDGLGQHYHPFDELLWLFRCNVTISRTTGRGLKVCWIVSEQSQEFIERMIMLPKPVCDSSKYPHELPTPGIMT